MRIHNTAADLLVDVPETVLDHGHVTLVDYMGGDARIVNAARVSIAGEAVKATTDDRTLIRYLLRHKHTTPFEKVRFEFCIKAPIFVARQWIRHRMSSTNEMSARYSVLPEEYYVPDVARLAFQSKNNKQGSGSAIPEDLAALIQSAVREHTADAFTLYRHLMGVPKSGESHEDFGPADLAELSAGGGVARELARAVLPVNVYTEWYWTIDLWNLMHFLNLRLDPHAQAEIRAYADYIVKCVRAVCPIAMEAWEDYIHQAKTFSRKELELLQAIIRAPSLETFFADCSEADMVKILGSKRELVEFKAKIGI